MPVATSITPPQAWAILSRHARDEMSTLRLRELCRDDDRVAALVEVYSSSSNVWIADLSRQRMTDSTMNHLLCLATSMGLKDFIRQVSWGRNDPQKPVIRPSYSNNAESSTSPEQHENNIPLDETEHPHHQQQMIPSMHMAIRVPKNPESGVHEEYAMLDGTTNVLPTIHSGWERVRSCSEAIRSGRHRGMTGSLLKDIVVVVMENNSIIHTVLESTMTALQMDADAAHSMVVTDNRPSLRLLGTAPVVRRTLQCVTSSDPQHLATVLESLDPASTLVVSIVVTGQEDSGRVTGTLKDWLIQGLTRSSRGATNSNNASPVDVSKHMLLVTGNDRIAQALSNDSADSIFLLPEFARSESLLSCSYATMLPLALVFGWEIVRQLLAGCHDMDKHFVETNPRHNIPVLLALTDIWNDLLGCPAHSITTGSAALKDYPAYVAAMEASLCGGPSRTRRAADHVVVVGDVLGRDHADTTNSTTTTSTMHSEMIMALDGQTDFVVTERLGSTSADVRSSMDESHDALVCNLLARADEMALSVSRPSVMLWFGKLHAFGCGQLLALTEHRALIKAHIWGVDPFYEPPRTRSVDYSDEFVRLLQDGEIDHGDDGHDRLTLATKTILTHYAGLVREQRTHQQKQEDEPS